MRVLTIAVVILIIASVTLLQMVLGLRAFSEQSREQRLSFQREETARQCEILRLLGTPEDRMVGLKC